MVQNDVQHLLEQKIWNNELGVPLPGSRVSIRGDEEYFSIPIMSPTTKTMQPRKDTPTPLSNGPTGRKIEPRETHLLMVIGGMLIVIQIIVSWLLHQYGKKFRAIQIENEALLKKEGEQGVDEMLRASNGFVETNLGGFITTIEPSEQFVPSQRPLVANNNKKPIGGRKVAKNKGGGQKVAKNKDGDGTNTSHKTVATSIPVTKDQNDEKKEDLKRQIRTSSSQNKTKERGSKASSTTSSTKLKNVTQYPPLTIISNNRSQQPKPTRIKTTIRRIIPDTAMLLAK
jgi:hypothetical protein